MQKLLCFFITIGVSQLVFAYPEFIGYGYNSCMACHFNGAGGQGLSDYGRALYGGELAAKPFWKKNVSDETLAESSNFLGKIQSPYWFKPGIKYRRLMNVTSPASANERIKYYVMQADLNLAFFTSEEAQKGMVATISHVPEISRALPNQPMTPDSEFMMKEYYLRWGHTNNTWTYFGLLDKVFGIRHADHTAFNRSPIRMGQNDQVHGVLWHRPEEKSDLFIHGFLGNLHLDGENQAPGFSIMYEKETRDRFRPGASARYESSKQGTWMGFAGHLRAGLNKGHALLYELGFKDSQLKNSSKETSVYQFIEFSYLLSRGYHFQSIIQTDQSFSSTDSSERYRWGFGLLALPMQRVEFRLQALQAKSRSRTSVEEDQWVGQAQLHFSL